MAASASPPTAAAAAAAGAPPRLPLRVGHGYDLHRLEAGRPLILGGVHLPHPVGCAGHSDGDAVYHCVVDGLLGALGEPDIGQLFPDTDPRFAGAASDAFVRAAAEVVAARGYAVANLDVTVLLERPKVSPVKAEMRANIAACLGVPVDRVNLKAKTGEKVDAVGEGRAVAVHAVVLLTALPEGDVPAAAAVAAEGAATPAGGGAGPAGVGPTIASRRSAPPSSSWTAKLLAGGVAAAAQKVGEEATEVVIEAVRGGGGGGWGGGGGNPAGVVAESADLLYHLLVLWEAAGVPAGDVWAALAAREGVSGVAEKAARKAG
ncbi:hypothetical protein I4F81_007557 [Pyropia yezoensis]|uniref:Uncharacterized protein n=1 Tax=Pyropia yezoensis TaxID=2788 RepID=A0ACC3C3Z7_PYRYE|nr:hypothetical protein I4F81_007557 [Neopyropia yezoensis]